MVRLWPVGLAAAAALVLAPAVVVAPEPPVVVDEPVVAAVVALVAAVDDEPELLLSEPQAASPRTVTPTSAAAVLIRWVMGVPSKGGRVRPLTRRARSRARGLPAWWCWRGRDRPGGGGRVSGEVSRPAAAGRTDPR